jgi:hypothetical protein
MGGSRAESSLDTGANSAQHSDFRRGVDADDLLAVAPRTAASAGVLRSERFSIAAAPDCAPLHLGKAEPEIENSTPFD